MQRLLFVTAYALSGIGSVTLTERFVDLHERWVLRRPVAVLAICALTAGFFGWHALDFGLDASADSLTLERDEDLRYYRAIRARYGSDNFLIVTFAPSAPLFTEPVLDHLDRLRERLRQLDDVESVVSILDVPLIKSPPIDLRDIGEGVRRLEEPDTDHELAEAELRGSELYRDLIISADGHTTALIVNMRSNERYIELRERRDALREKDFFEGLTEDEATELVDVDAEFRDLTHRLLTREREAIASVRGVLDAFRDIATLHLGGVPMIVADSIDFIRHDLILFGIAVIAFLVTILFIAFRKPRWAILSLANCGLTAVVMLGILGWTGWKVTVVSSNFLSLLLILTLALTLHIIVRYREAHVHAPDADQMTLLRESLGRIVVPCLYTALTTMVAFGALLVSGIRPVIDFGWMMVIGISIGFVFSFTFFPAALMFLEPGEPRILRDVTAAITGFFARIITRRTWQTIAVAAIVALVGGMGITKLTVENSFIDYYKKTTEIYQGMVLIDRELGGTTPLDVIIDAPVIATDSSGGGVDEADDDDFVDDFEDIYGEDVEGEGGITAESYWFNHPRLRDVIAIHDYLDGLPETGKVISIATAARLLSELDENVLTDNVLLSVVYKRMPDEVRDALITPYLSADGDQLRFSIRVYGSDPTLRRNELIRQIPAALTERFALAPEQAHLSGMLVLYNNMLQSLFRSQMLTLGAVFLAIFGMFVMLFRSLRMAVTAIIPNILAAGFVLGLIGWLRIPLDLMTITIAAITVGIAVDDTIHYVHRFGHELPKDGDYWAAVRRCHGTIGRAMYYTSVTIMLGFSILALSQFKPTIYFGLLTGIAMLVALIANLALLPVLIVAFRAAGKRRQSA